MPTYKVEIEKKARKFIDKQSKEQQLRIYKGIFNLPYGDTKILAGKKNYWRLRVGDYRIIYRLNDDILIITIVEIGNRGQIYNNY